jgi:hypothetical protein
MDRKDFILSKLKLAKQDKQKTFSNLSEPLAKMIEKDEASEIVKVPVDGNWFKIEFDAVKVKEDRLVISAKKMESPIQNDTYMINFEGTRAAYLAARYNHPSFRCPYPYIDWDIRSYAKHPHKTNMRVYVHEFRLQKEIPVMIKKMEERYNTSHCYNKYVNDNLQRLQTGIKQGKSPEQLELIKSNGMMESLGYTYVDVLDRGNPKGEWRDIYVHWCKSKNQRIVND